MLLKGFKEFINESSNGATYQDLKLLLELGIVSDITDDVYKSFDQGLMSKDEMIDWVTPICKKYNIIGWSISDNGLVDVDGSVYLSLSNLNRLPLKFGKVTGNFDCGDCHLTILEGAPQEVVRNFRAYKNNLTTLAGGPKLVRGDFKCFSNQLISLEGAPQGVGGTFDCSHNRLVTLNGAPQTVGRDFDCSYNRQLTSLDGGPSNVGGTIIVENTGLNLK